MNKIERGPSLPALRAFLASLQPHRHTWTRLGEDFFTCSTCGAIRPLEPDTTTALDSSETKPAE